MERSGKRRSSGQRNGGPCQPGTSRTRSVECFEDQALSAKFSVSSFLPAAKNGEGIEDISNVSAAMGEASNGRDRT